MKRTHAYILAIYSPIWTFSIETRCDTFRIYLCSVILVVLVPSLVCDGIVEWTRVFFIYWVHLPIQCPSPQLVHRVVGKITCEWNSRVCCSGERFTRHQPTLNSLFEGDGGCFRRTVPRLKA